MKHVVTVLDGKASVVSLLTDGEIYTAVAGYHPNFDTILDRVSKGQFDNSLVGLFDVEKHVRDTFNQLTERVAIRDGKVTVDGDTREGAIAKQILRLVEEGHVEELTATVKFLENLEANPNKHSREQLGDWIDKHKFTITSQGYLVGYKGVRVDDQGNYTSISKGPGVVDGKEVNGYVPNPIGAVVEMSRSKVLSNPAVGCASGLHVGTWAYAKDFAQGAVLEVHVNPRDVVSVPTDCNWQKIRACRYKVVGVATAQYTAPVIKVDDDQNADVKVKVTDAGKPKVKAADNPRTPNKPFLPGDRVEVVNHLTPSSSAPIWRKGRSARESLHINGYAPRGTLATVKSCRNSASVEVVFDDPDFGYGQWGADRFALVKNEKPAKVDTTQNYKAQKRYPKGHPKAGQFVPKGATI